MRQTLIEDNEENNTILSQVLALEIKRCLEAKRNQAQKILDEVKI